MATALVPTSEVPHLKYRFENLNPVQSELFPHRESDINIVVASTTGSGKTEMAELVMDTVLQSGKKVLYASPMKALTEEKHWKWTNPESAFARYKVSQVTGDYQLTAARVEELQKADVILLTSEMLDSRCRRMEDEKNNWLLEAGLCVVDGEAERQEDFPYPLHLPSLRPQDPLCPLRRLLSGREQAGRLEGHHQHEPEGQVPHLLPHEEARSRHHPDADRHGVYGRLP